MRRLAYWHSAKVDAIAVIKRAAAVLMRWFIVLDLPVPVSVAVAAPVSRLPDE